MALRFEVACLPYSHSLLSKYEADGSDPDSLLWPRSTPVKGSNLKGQADPLAVPYFYCYQPFKMWPILVDGVRFF